MRRKLIVGLGVIFLVVLIGGVAISLLMDNLQSVTSARYDVEVFHLKVDRLNVEALNLVERVRRTWDDPEKFRGTVDRAHSFNSTVGGMHKEFLNTNFGRRGCGACHEKPGLLVKKVESHLLNLDRSFGELTLIASLFVTRKEGVGEAEILEKLNDSLDRVQFELNELAVMLAPMITHIDAESQNSLVRIERIHTFTIVLTTFLVLLGALILTNAISVPVTQLTKGTEAIVDGKYDFSIDIKGMDEVGLLAERFNTMARTIALRERSILEKKNELEELNANLEKKVQERTKDLRLSKADLDRKVEELEATNEELQASYVQLETTAAELEEAQEKLQDNYNYLKEVNRELQQANEVKNKFLSIMSHELRTPLTVINGYLSLILDKNFGEPSPELKEIMRVIKDQAKNQLSLIEDLLDLTRIESGEFRLFRQPCDAIELIRKVTESYGPRIDEKEIKLELDFGKDLPQVQWDQQKMVQVFQNLIDNAVKFTPFGGTISIGVRFKSDFIELRISDNGIGIPEDMVDKVFDRFFQVDSSSTRQYGGSGLGLSIVQEIVQAHNGRIFVESREEEGTTFLILMPLGEAERPRVSAGDDDAVASEKPYGELPRGNGEKVLVVDDDPAFLKMMDTILPREGYRVEVCDVSTDVPDRVIECGAHLVLLDLMMPDVDGYEVCRMLRENPETKSVPILIVSASSGKEVSRRVYEVGADDHLIKPFDQYHLFYLIYSLLESSRGKIAFEGIDDRDGDGKQTASRVD
jgi:signal transduction histidine kinase/ActR/RegA family two-component response regulator